MDIINYSKTKKLEEQINNFVSKGYNTAVSVGNVDLNILKTQGKYTTNYSIHTNAPTTGNNLFMIDITGDPEYLVQEARSLYGKKYYRIYNYGTWGAWQEIVTTTQLAWITATLQNGWTGTLQYRKNQIGQLEIKALLVAGTVSHNTIITTLPTEYRPQERAPITVINISGGSLLTSLLVDPASGQIAVKSISPSDPLATGMNLAFQCILV